MATTFVAHTPSRDGSPASINTPPTPRLGSFGDNWEPYSPPAPRKSARLSSRTTNRTPSPHPSGCTSKPSHLPSSPKPSTSDPSNQSSNMTSPPSTSPQKKRQPPTDSRRASGSLTVESIRTAAAALGQSQPQQTGHPVSRVAAMALPTPAKTPARKHSEQSEKDVNAVARNLFGKQQSPKQSRAKRYNGISLDSFEAEEGNIEIYTDSQDRLPEVDHSNENPFYGESGIAASAVPVRRSSRNKKNVAIEKEIVDEKLKREDGLLYVFRGKKVFRKFTDSEAAARPTVKPRLLFPSTKASKENELVPEEEIETDIEEPVKDKAANEEEITTPIEDVDEKVDTPKAPKFAPASPPATSRATRSKKLITDEPTPVKLKGKRTGNASPFAGWRRTKSSPSSSTHGQKRPGEPLTNDPAQKRTKT